MTRHIWGLANLFIFFFISRTLVAKNLAKPGEYVVKIRSHALGPQTALFSHRIGAAKFLGKSGEFRLKKIQAKSELEDLKRSPEVEYVEPNFIYSIHSGARAPKAPPSPTQPVVPSNPQRGSFSELKSTDPYFSLLWGLKNFGQQDPRGVSGKANADIAATGAWTQSTGSRKVVVAVIDTGVDLSHPDLKANLWSKPGDPSVKGYNAITKSFVPNDDNGHGTHVAGTIGAVGGNGIGVVGVNWEVSIMPVKFMDGDGSGTLSDAIDAIDFARENGAQVMNNSWGGGGFSQALLDAITRARDAGILFVAAAGNEGNNNDQNPSYPASYDLGNVISVAANDNNEKLASFSNYGAKSVHISAPGVNILSTIPGGKYDVMSGTSMAAPAVSGAAALMLAHNPNLDASDLKQRLINSAEKLPASYQGKVSRSARLNVYNLLMGISL